MRSFIVKPAWLAPLTRSEQDESESRAAAQEATARNIARMVFWLISTIWQVTTDNAHALIARFTGHLVVLALVAAAVVLGSMTWKLPAASRLTQPKPVTTSAALASRANLMISNRGPSWQANSVESITRAAVPLTDIPSRLRRGVITYTVQPGDTVQGIAILYSIQPETIMWSNSAIEDDPDYLQIGQQVVVLPIDGVYHTVAKNDTLDSIAKKYKVKLEDITGVSFNNLQPPDYHIEPGMKLIVAGGTKPYVPKMVTAYSGQVPAGAKGSGRYIWPVYGTLTQGYWWGHRALDIAAPTGTPVYASDGGYISFAGWTDVGYGRLVIVDHGNGCVTYYAHLNTFNVSVGQSVVRGAVLGGLGSTGNSTGPHTHFEIRCGGALLNPRLYLP